MVVDRTSDGYLATVTPYWPDRENLGITGWELGPYESMELAKSLGGTESRILVERWIQSGQAK